MRLKTLSACFVTLLFVSSMMAVDSDHLWYQMHLDHKDRTITVCTLCNTTAKQYVWSSHLTEEMGLTLRRGDQVDIWIDNPNPLLYKYEFGGIDAFPNADAKAVEAFTRVLSQAVSGFSVAQTVQTSLVSAANKLESVSDQLPASQKQQIQATTSDLNTAIGALSRMRAVDPELATRINANALRVDRVLGELQRSRTAVTPEELHEAATDLAAAAKVAGGAPVEDGEAFLEANGFDDQFFAGLQDALDKLRINHATINQLLVDSADPAKWEKVKKTTEDWHIDEVKDNIIASYTKMNTAVGKLSFRDQGPLAVQLRSAMQTKDDIAHKLGELVRVAESASELGKPVELRDSAGKLVTLDFDTLTDRTYHVKISFRGVDEGISGTVRDKVTARSLPTGEFRFIDRPYHTVRVTAGAAAVYSLLRTPQFKAVKNGSDLVIARQLRDRVSGENVAAMMNLTPHRWDDDFFGGAFQLGVTPGDHLAAYLGGGIVFKKYFFLGVGATVAQVDRLARGLSPGQVIQSTDDLKLEKEYKAGAYFHITFNLTK